MSAASQSQQQEMSPVFEDLIGLYEADPNVDFLDLSGR